MSSDEEEVAVEGEEPRAYFDDDASDCSSERSQPAPPSLPQAAAAAAPARRGAAPGAPRALRAAPVLRRRGGGPAAVGRATSRRRPPSSSCFAELRSASARATRRGARALVGLKRLILSHIDFRRQRRAAGLGAHPQALGKLRACADLAQMVVVGAALACLALEGSGRHAVADQGLPAAALPAALLCAQVISLACLRFRNVQASADEALTLRTEGTQILQSLNEHREQVEPGRSQDLTPLWIEIERRCQQAMAFSSRFAVRYGRSG